jgi:hypothetical protein
MEFAPSSFADARITENSYKASGVSLTDFLHFTRKRQNAQGEAAAGTVAVHFSKGAGNRSYAAFI